MRTCLLGEIIMITLLLWLKLSKALCTSYQANIKHLYAANIINNNISSFLF